MNPSASKTRILLMRHAETSTPDRFHGAESDVGLGVRGIEQAQSVGLAIRSGDWHGIQPGDPIVSSSQLRARQTARLIRETIGEAASRDSAEFEALHERLMGPMSGMPKTEGWPIYEETKRRWISGDLEYTHDGGESYRAIRDRVVPAFAEVAKRYRGSTVALVGHGIAIRVFLTSVIPGLSAADFDRVSLQFVTPHELVWCEEGWRANRIAWEP